MKNLQVRTTNAISQLAKYTGNIKNTIVFLRHSEDKIRITSDEQVNLEVYDNGELIFTGSKAEFFDKLKAGDNKKTDPADFIEMMQKETNVHIGDIEGYANTKFNSELSIYENKYLFYKWIRKAIDKLIES